ncbi:acetyl-CoA:L-glutamate N-acetyltransferase Ecym_6311 [Eremothecium cymbalariae DBVPG|uniref:Amino-acid acetyltransferase, mitochondrial n=1 Tax=Eremothecium cymbalariae (strain CBS 270.75 / DBVPG 7215 / KCTC 17166 / NRRL Y-17582) TaxID=931890 RepID=G8JUB0_ERECY|nr:hypothetical protein Ecym_6311 [Eremothecium cymbalariae DBVPG\
MIRRWFATKVGYHDPNFKTNQLILSVLKSTATRREAKDYISKYGKPGVLNHCIIYMRDVSSYSQGLIQDLTATIGRLQMLGVSPVVVLSPSPNVTKECNDLRGFLHNYGLKSVPVSNCMSWKENGDVSVKIPELSAVMPIILPFIYDEKLGKTVMVHNKTSFMSQLVSHIPYHIEKFFIINELGGIPSVERHQKSHVFVNLSQEYELLAEQLQKQISDIDALSSLSHTETVETVINRDKLLARKQQLLKHKEDLEMMNAVLTQLSHPSTGLVTNVSSAAVHSKKNPLLHNVLTDRSLISSSLPSFKRRDILHNHAWYELPDTTTKEEPASSNEPIFSTTVLKQGVDIKVYNHSTLTPQNTIGLAPDEFETPLNEKIPTGDKLDLYKIRRVIEKSFGRSLNLEHYLKRINGHIASIIVIGEYEGIAILTHEGPEGRKFAYLDKFAVLPHLRGSLCISDIIFNLMFKKFPHELLWRSKRDNIVNKWYFQRSVAVMDLSLNLGDGDEKNSMFKLFYYGDRDKETFENLNRLKEYAVCIRDIQPSWNDEVT